MWVPGAVRDELTQQEVSRPCCRRAELAAVLRFARGVHIIDGSVLVEVEVDTGAVAHRVARDIQDLYGHTCQVRMLIPDGPHSAGRYAVRVVTDGAGLARQTGLIDRRGRLVRGLPSRVVAGGVCDAQAVWRGAFVVQGLLRESSRGAVVEINCPGLETAVALLGAARRMGVRAKTREGRGTHRVMVGDGEDIAALLSALGARSSLLAWRQHRERREAQVLAHPPATFGGANLRRSERAAVAAATRVRHALALLDDHAPQHLVAAGRLRLEHPTASLEQLGQLCDPPLTKDTVSGRIRRLLELADQRARQRGVHDAEAALAKHTDTWPPV